MFSPVTGIKGFDDTPMVADAGNTVYSIVVKRLIKSVAEKSPDVNATMAPWGLQVLSKMGEEKAGDVCEAVLAAANVEVDEEDERPQLWGTL